ncbi:MAG: hypothetical protein J6B48_07640 [Clostridia bacterium]|nr:hypothetical protein [Clostridia bacterium]
MNFKSIDFKKINYKKIGKIAYNLVMYLFLGLCAVALVLTVTAKRSSDGAAEIFGYQLRTVLTPSMEKCDETDVSDFGIKSIPQNSMVLVQSVPEDEMEAEKWYSELRVGDVLTFRYVYVTQITITHRITSITAKDSGGYIIELAGDNKSSDTSQLYQTIDTSDKTSPNFVLGKVTAVFSVIGFIVSLLKKPIGLVFIVIIPCFIIILLEILKILGAYNAEKQKRNKEEAKKKDDELEELKKRLAALEKREETEENGPLEESLKADTIEQKTDIKEEDS